MKLINIFPGTHIKIIAEIGINHCGNFNTAKDMIRAASDAGADAVKFQTFTPELLYSKYTSSLVEKVNLFLSQRGTDEIDFNELSFSELNDDYSIINFFKKFALKDEHVLELKKFADSLGIVFLSAPFDLPAVDLLEKAGVSLYKVASSELSNLPLVRRLVQTRKPLIISTGISKQEEISRVVKLCRQNETEFILLHCVSLYPVGNSDVNLSRIAALKQEFACEVGFSDHSSHIDYALDSVLLGAKYVEKHFMLDGQSCPDENVSINQFQMSDLVKKLSQKQVILGNAELSYCKNQESVAISARRSIFATRDIDKGEIISDSDIVVKRPGVGVSPMLIDRVIGKTIMSSIRADEPFLQNMFDLS